MFSGMGQPMVAQGRVIRVDPMSASPADLPGLCDLPPEKAGKKMNEIRQGGALREENPPFPDNRSCQDCVWALLFVFTIVTTLGYGFASSGELVTAVNHKKDHSMDDVEFPPDKVLLSSLLASGFSSLVAAFLYIVLAHRAPACVVWTSLLFSPFLMIFMGIAMILVGTSTTTEVALVGLVFIALGICQLSCVLCCWRDLIPFMIKLTEVVADVIDDHPCLLFVGAIGAVLGFLWTVLCQASFVAIYLENKEMMAMVPDRALTFVATVIFVWGAGVANNICHVTYCGVFGRWYYGRSEGSPLMPSFNVAVSTSLGSICMGSLLVAFVRALEKVAQSVRRGAQEDGNPLLCVVALVLECFIGCLGDILEYFNEWAYVQCAVRGTSFITSAKITYSMMTCANLQYVASDLLLNSLVSLGGLLCGLVGAASGAATGYALDGLTAATWGGGLGFIVGLMAGVASVSIVNSGVKTILACWADDPEPLQRTHEEIAQEFENRIRNKIG